MPGPDGARATMTDDEIREAAASLPFFQRYEIRPGIWTPGVHDIPAHLDLIRLPDRLDGLDVCDLGTNDGALTWEAGRRGAARVVAADHPTDWAMAGHGRSARDCFDLGYRATGSEAEVVAFDFDEPGWPDIGTFDVVLALGVIYHLKGPFPFLGRCAGLTRPGGLVIVETHLADLGAEGRPLCEFYSRDQFNRDPTNYWGFNGRCVLDMLDAAGFAGGREVGRRPYAGIPGWRGAFHSRKPGSR